MVPSTETGLDFGPLQEPKVQRNYDRLRVVAQSDVKASISMQWMKNQTLTLEMYPYDEYTNPY